jgi:hypothetical protein
MLALNERLTDIPIVRTELGRPFLNATPALRSKIRDISNARSLPTALDFNVSVRFYLTLSIMENLLYALSALGEWVWI